MNRSKNKTGFTLVEVMIAMTVIVLVIFAATNILVSVIRSNNENVNTLVAYGLAQEGLEGMRNMRDSNWLLDAKFNGQIGGVDVWGESFSEGYYTIDLAALERSTLGAQSASVLAASTPWKLLEVSQEAAEKLGNATQILKYEDEQSGEVRYGHSAGNPTVFHRYVLLEDVSENPLKTTKLRVSSVVNWTEAGGRTKEVRLDTILTDWNQGQL